MGTSSEKPRPSGSPPSEVHTPYVPASHRLPEITLKAVILGALLSILLAGANAYLGLLAGMTVSASIPAAVISMALLRLFRQSNILENNIVQTAASAGESLAAGVIFTFPALVILEVWSDFNYWETTAIAGVGGLIGVLFTIPIRRALVVQATLRFPEGVATAEVLKVGDAGGQGVRSLVAGGVFGAIFKFGQSGLGLWTQAIEGARQVGSSLFYMGANLLPSLVAIGYIVGVRIAVLVFLGGALNWLIAIPVYAGTQPWPDGINAHDWAWEIWSSKTRYLGVGAMLIGGVWTVIRMGRHLITGITSGLTAYRGTRGGSAVPSPRTEQDTPMPWVLGLLALSVIPMFFIFALVTGRPWIALFMAVVMLIAGFLFSSVAAYMAGLVGSSNNPVSGVTIATLLTSSLLLLLLMGTDTSAGPAAAILIGAVVCCAAAIGGDNMQDLKAGWILGATPRRQQFMQGLGVVAAALVVAPILSLLLNAYGIGEPVHEGREPLPAPQATLMASVTQGVFDRNLPWTWTGIGMAIAAAIIGIDQLLERRQATFRMPVLAVAVGLYLPLELETPILLGGLVGLVGRQMSLRRQRLDRSVAGGADRTDPTHARQQGEQRGMLFAAGLITGEAVLGILLAIPIVFFRGENPFLLSGPEGPLPAPLAESLPAAWPGVLLLLLVMGLLLRCMLRRANGRKA